MEIVLAVIKLIVAFFSIFNPLLPYIREAFLGKDSIIKSIKRRPTVWGLTVAQLILLLSFFIQTNKILLLQLKNENNVHTIATMQKAYDILLKHYEYEQHKKTEIKPTTNCTTIVHIKHIKKPPKSKPVKKVLKSKPINSIDNINYHLKLIK